jgi:hypothetical protein
MFHRNTFALSLVLAFAAVLAARPSLAGQPSNGAKKTGAKVVLGNGWGNAHQNQFYFQNQHGLKQQFAPKFVPTTKVQVLYCVTVRHPSHYGNWNWHTVKCFYSVHQAEAFAANLNAKHFGHHGFAVRIDRKW